MSDVTAQDRLLDDFRAIVRSEIRAVMGYPGTYEYTIARADSSTLDATPTDTSQGLPAINNLPLRASPIGAYTPSVGKACHVVFLGGLKTRPVVVWCQPDAGAPVVRVGDDVNAGYLVLTSTPPGTIAAYFPGTTVGEAAANAAAGLLTPPGTVQALDGGKTTSGSSQVSSE